MGARIKGHMSYETHVNVLIGGIKLNMHGSQVIACSRIHVREYTDEGNLDYVLSIPDDARHVHLEQLFGRVSGYQLGAVMRDCDPEGRGILADDFQEILQKLVNQHVPFGTSVRQAEPALV